MLGFYGKKGRARELLAKGKKGLILGKDGFFAGRREWQGFYHTDRCLFFLWGMEGFHWTDDLISADQNVPE